MLAGHNDCFPLLFAADVKPDDRAGMSVAAKMSLFKVSAPPPRHATSCPLKPALKVIVTAKGKSYLAKLTAEPRGQGGALVLGHSVLCWGAHSVEWGVRVRG